MSSSKICQLADLTVAPVTNQRQDKNVLVSKIQILKIPPPEEVTM